MNSFSFLPWTAAILIFCFASTDLLAGQDNPGRPITWVPQRVSSAIHPGTSLEDTVFLVSTATLGSATLFIVPELRPYVTVVPESLTINAGDTNFIRLVLSAPAGAPDDTLSGTIHVRTGKRTRPQVLKIDLIIGNLSTVSALQAPGKAVLSQNYPNPFNPVTTIHYELSANVFVSLKVYNLLGQEVATLVHAEQRPGIYDVRMDGQELASGVYLYRLYAGEFTQTRRLVLTR